MLKIQNYIKNSVYDFYKIEKRLPIFLMIINDRKNTDYYHQYFNIHENQQTLITGYDFYSNFFFS